MALEAVLRMMTTHSLFLVFGQPGVPTAVPPWPSGTRALGQRETGWSIILTDYNRL